MGTFIDRRVLIQCLLLSLVTFVFVVPKTVKHTIGIVPETYQEGSERLHAKTTPYAHPTYKKDWFKYSPLFAWLYTPLTKLPRLWHALTWVWINIFVFWLGISLWLRLDRDTSKWIWIATLVTSVELNISLLHQQVNALLIGLTMIGIAAYRDKRLTAAGSVLALATNFKVIPGPFLGCLLLDGKFKFAKAAFVTAVLTFLIPITVTGFALNLEFHRDWIMLLMNDVNSIGIADVETYLTKVGWPALGFWLRWIIAGTTAVLMLAPFLRRKTPQWDLWITIGLTGLLLWNPRTESPTFVMMTPAYIFLTKRILAKESYRKFGIPFLCVCFFLITISFSDVWPKSVWDPGYPTCAAKTVGTFFLWVATLGFIAFDRNFEEISTMLRMGGQRVPLSAT